MSISDRAYQLAAAEFDRRYPECGAYWQRDWLELVSSCGYREAAARYAAEHGWMTYRYVIRAKCRPGTSDRGLLYAKSRADAERAVCVGLSEVEHGSQGA